MEIKYDEQDEVYWIREEDKPLIDPKGKTMVWVDLEEAKKYITNLEMIRLIYGNQ